MKWNGLMIDCSRLLERKDYYPRLIDFMAEWGMNVLLFHFCDDHGCSVALPGFRHLAAPHAFTPREMRALIARARSRGIDVIPEIETFGHTRFITDHPRHRHLGAGRRTRVIRFNAIDPLNPETHRLMSRLVAAVARLFPSPCLHLGCDEVDLRDYARRRGLDVAAVWTDYVNRMIALARAAGKTPMIWADHVEADDAIARALRKDVILVDWRYRGDVAGDVLPRLRRFGFRDLVVAPSLACYRHRFLPTDQAFENTALMAVQGRRHGAMGLINTVWCPYRYLQNALYYGVAWSAGAARCGGAPDEAALRRRFARKTFGTALVRPLDVFLRAWPRLRIDFLLAQKLVWPGKAVTAADARHLRQVRQWGDEAVAAADRYAPRHGREIWDGMVLAARGARLCAEGMLLGRSARPAAARVQAYRRELRDVRRLMSAEWDRTRYADDPQKRRPRFPNEADSHAMVLIRRLPRPGGGRP